MTKQLEVRTTTDARTDLPSIVARMHEDGLYAEPVLLGPHRRPQAVIISIELYKALADAIDAIQSAPAIRQRLQATAAAGGPVTTTLGHLADQVGADLGD
ncbi:type II toxin-antitoxin system Phd/YefM family antitoxin [Nonomuraea sp. NPDC049695]|uniref:type II toxin-antitoxin system Phd/YefM family antitoxin n=1 Tax=Nonomuraea sp. NPDC049695 TaxID=3154734 RepID=UPI0034357EA5